MSVEGVRIVCRLLDQMTAVATDLENRHGRSPIDPVAIQDGELGKQVREATKYLEKELGALTAK